MSGKTRVGRVQVLVQPDGRINVQADGEVSSAEWIYALELLKSEFLQKARQGVPVMTNLRKDIPGFNPRELS